LKKDLDQPGCGGGYVFDAKSAHAVMPSFAAAAYLRIARDKDVLRLSSSVLKVVMPPRWCGIKERLSIFCHIDDLGSRGTALGA
jgi:hypothetical protein